MLRCQHKFHIILYCRGKLISQLIKVAATGGIHQHSLNWILHYITQSDIFAAKTKFKSLHLKKKKRVRDKLYPKKAKERAWFHQDFHFCFIVCWHLLLASEQYTIQPKKRETFSGSLILYCNSQQYRLGQILMNYSVNPNKTQGTNSKRGSP